MHRLLVDTNILLDAIADDRPETESASEILRQCNSRGGFGMTSSLSLKDVYYISSKAKGEKWAREAVNHLMGLLAIVPVDAEVCDLAWSCDEPDFEDAIIRACAELNDADFIITRDRDAFAHSTVRSVTAPEYLEIARTRQATVWRS